MPRKREEVRDLQTDRREAEIRKIQAFALAQVKAREEAAARARELFGAGSEGKRR